MINYGAEELTNDEIEEIFSNENLPNEEVIYFLVSFFDFIISC